MAEKDSGVRVGKERRGPAEVTAERETRRAEFEERNAAAVAAEKALASETPKQREKRRSQIFQSRQQRAVEHEERNRKAAPGPAANKMLTGKAAVPENKAAETETDAGDGLDNVDFASPEAREAAAGTKLTADAFKRQRRGSERGFTKADVERIAGNAEADED